MGKLLADNAHHLARVEVQVEFLDIVAYYDQDFFCFRPFSLHCGLERSSLLEAPSLNRHNVEFNRCLELVSGTALSVAVIFEFGSGLTFTSREDFSFMVAAITTLG